MTTLLVCCFMLGTGLAGFLTFVAFSPEPVKAMFDKYLWDGVDEEVN